VVCFCFCRAHRYAAASEFLRRFKVRILPWQCKLMRGKADEEAGEAEGEAAAAEGDGDEAMPAAAGAGSGSAASGAPGKGAFQSTSMAMDG
jgi:hypothetical protein